MKLFFENISNFSPNKKHFFCRTRKNFSDFSLSKTVFFLSIIPKTNDNPHSKQQALHADVLWPANGAERIEAAELCVLGVSFEGRKVRFEQCKKGPRLFRVYFCRGWNTTHLCGAYFINHHFKMGIFHKYGMTNGQWFLEGPSVMG